MERTQVRERSLMRTGFSSFEPREESEAEPCEVDMYNINVIKCKIRKIEQREAGNLPSDDESNALDLPQIELRDNRGISALLNSCIVMEESTTSHRKRTSSFFASLENRREVAARVVA